MNKRLLAFMILGTAFVFGADKDPVSQWLADMTNESYAAREGAEKALIAYLDERPAELMKIGHRLFEAGKKDPEVQSRTNRILAHFAPVVWVDGPDDASLHPTYTDNTATTEGLPFTVIIVTSRDMLVFYRSTVQTEQIGWKIPPLDLNHWLLLEVMITHGNRTPYRLNGRGLPCLKSPTCERQFEKQETVFYKCA